MPYICRFFLSLKIFAIFPQMVYTVLVQSRSNCVADNRRP